MKQKPTKLQQLFEGHRRKASLTAWTHLRTTAGESRIKMDLRLPLLNESVVGMNDVMAEAFTLMAKDDSKISRTSLNVEMEGMTLECFLTGEMKSPAVLATGVRFQKFALVSAGEGEKRTLDLTVVVYLPASIQLRDWAWENLHATFFLESVYSQSEIDWVGEAEVIEDNPDVPAGGEEYGTCSVCGRPEYDCDCPDDDEEDDDEEDQDLDPLDDGGEEDELVAQERRRAEKAKK